MKSYAGLQTGWPSDQRRSGTGDGNHRFQPRPWMLLSEGLIGGLPTTCINNDAFGLANRTLQRRAWRRVGGSVCVQR